MWGSWGSRCRWLGGPVNRFIEDRTGWTITQFVRTARRYPTVQIRVGDQILTAEDPLTPELRDAPRSSADPGLRTS
jgi:hypothetical protein